MAAFTLGSLNLLDHDKHYILADKRDMGTAEHPGSPSRVQTYRLLLKGTNADNLGTNAANIRRVLSQAAQQVTRGTPIEFVYQPGSVAISFQVFGGTLTFDQRAITYVEHGVAVEAILRLETSDYGRLATRTLASSATLTNGSAVLALPNIKGDGPAGVTLRVHDHSSNGETINGLLIGAKTLEGITTTTFDPLHDLTADAGATSVTDADLAGGVGTRLTLTSAWQTVGTVDQPQAASDSHGRFAVVAQVRDSAVNEASVPAPSNLTVDQGGVYPIQWNVEAQSARVFAGEWETQPHEGNLLLMAIGVYSLGTTVTVTPANGWTHIGQAQANPSIGTYFTMNLYYKVAGDDEDLELSAFLGTSMEGFIGWAEWAGITGTSPLDKSVTHNNNGTTTFTTGTTAATTQAYELAFFAAIGQSLPGTFTVPWGQLGGTSSNVSTLMAFAMGDRTLTSTGAVTATSGVSSTGWADVLATFKGRQTTAPTMTAGRYDFYVAALDASGNESLAAGPVTLDIYSGAAYLAWEAPSVTPAQYRVYYVDAAGVSEYVNTGSTATSYSIINNSGTAGSPITGTSLAARLRLSLATISGSVYRTLPEVATAIGGGEPEFVVLGIGPLPPLARSQTGSQERWRLKIEAKHPTLTGKTITIGRVWLIPLEDDEHVLELSYVAGGSRYGLGTKGVWEWHQPATGRQGRAILRGERLTLTAANLITDATRVTNTSGDGRTPPDSSVGIWKGATNLISNGGVETNTTGWVNSGGTISRVTAQQKFGTASGQIVTSNAAANEGAYHAFAGAAATQYTVSAWVRGTSGTVRIALYDDVSGKQASSPVTLTTTWQRITVTATTGGGATTFRAYVETDVQQSLTYQVDGVQVETGGVATPYVETNGGTASRTAATLTAPNGSVGLDETQSWVALRFMVPTAQNAPLFVWGDDGNNVIYLYTTAAGGLSCGRASAGNFNEATSGIGSGVAFNAENTVILKWTASNLQYSINGGAFATVGSGPVIPVLSSSTLRLGHDNNIFGAGALYLNGQLRWAAMGTGTLTNADATSINALGNSDPIWSDFPTAAAATVLYDGGESTQALGTTTEQGTLESQGSFWVGPNDAVLVLAAKGESGHAHGRDVRFRVEVEVSENYEFIPEA